MTVRIDFDRGTLVLTGLESLMDSLKLPSVQYDPRVKQWRAPAVAYRDIVLVLHRSKIPYEDQARNYTEPPMKLQIQREPFPHQREAVEHWSKCGQQGVVVLPTGAGKTFVAQLIMQKVSRSTLVVTPTLDLMHQWFSVLGAAFQIPIGLIGGGEYDLQPVTVTTYDSAYLHMERLGNQFGLIVFDECHHLPGASYAIAAESCLAPFRLGLTATPERADSGEARYRSLIGPIVYRREIHELAGNYLADYETVILTVKLSEEEQEEYEQERSLYLNFVREKGISFAEPNGWGQFLAQSSRSPEGRRAFLAYRRQKEIAQASGGKLRLLRELLHRHRFDQVLIFTSDNLTVYEISREMLIPAITHQTKVKERHAYLEGFNKGEFPFLITSKVLNEGVDVPAASVAIILSGSGSVREHVQRLGRILRKSGDKAAILYEIVTENTAEMFVSQRRTQHSAYQ